MQFSSKISKASLPTTVPKMTIDAKHSDFLDNLIVPLDILVIPPFKSFSSSGNLLSIYELAEALNQSYHT